MEEKLFREKSMEQLSAPEQLAGYLRVTGPGIWVALGGIIVLLAGLLIWGVFGSIITTVTVPAIVKDGMAACYVLDDDINPKDEEIEVRIGDVWFTTQVDEAGTITLDASDDPILYESGYLSPGKKVYVLTGATELKDGYYKAVVTTEVLKPISLLFAKE